MDSKFKQDSQRLTRIFVPHYIALYTTRELTGSDGTGERLYIPWNKPCAKDSLGERTGTQGNRGSRLQIRAEFETISCGLYATEPCVSFGSEPHLLRRAIARGQPRACVNPPDNQMRRSVCDAKWDVPHLRSRTRWQITLQCNLKRVAAQRHDIVRWVCQVVIMLTVSD